MTGYKMNSGNTGCDKCSVSNCNKCATDKDKCTECGTDSSNNTLYGEKCLKAMKAEDCKDG